MSSDQIKNFYIEIDKTDKFTKNQKIRSKKRITLLDINFKRTIDLGISYVNLNSDDFIVFDINYTVRDRILAQEFVDDIGYIKDGVLYFLLDEKETIKIEKNLAYIPNDHMMGSLMGRYKETLHLITDVATMTKIASAEKIEFRLSSHGLGNECEGELNREDTLIFKGFYNGAFDPEFSKEELEIHVVQGIKKQKKLDKEIRKIEKEFDVIKSNDEDKKQSRENQTKPPPIESVGKCFIITATMGDPFHPIVDEFRVYRDKHLLTNKLGRSFVSFYYKIGPYLAFIIGKSAILRKLSLSFIVNPIYKRIKNDRTSKQN
jgi:hypothetical protein